MSGSGPTYFEMKFYSTKSLRTVIQSALFFSPRPVRVFTDNWIRGRKEYRKLKQADFAVVSLPKSGRTWLRVMLSRYYQQKLGLREHSILGFDNFFKENPAAARVLFSHDYVLRSYTGSRDSKKDYFQTKTILLVRDPRDLMVSQFYQWRYRMSSFKRKLHSTLEVNDSVSIFEFATNKDHGIPYYIDFMNSWQKDLHRMSDVLLVRYEDMRVNPSKAMGDILSFVGESAALEEISDTVEYAKFENMRKMEEKQAFRTESKRLFSGNVSNPDAFKTRRAKVGGYADYLTPEQIEVINGMIADQLSPEFGYNDV